MGQIHLRENLSSSLNGTLDGPTALWTFWSREKFVSLVGIRNPEPPSPQFSTYQVTKQLTSWSGVILDQLKVRQLVKILVTFCGTHSVHISCTTDGHLFLSQMNTVRVSYLISLIFFLILFSLLGPGISSCFFPSESSHIAYVMASHTVGRMHLPVRDLNIKSK